MGENGGCICFVEEQNKDGGKESLEDRCGVEDLVLGEVVYYDVVNDGIYVIDQLGE